MNAAAKGGTSQQQGGGEQKGSETAPGPLSDSNLLALAKEADRNSLNFAQRTYLSNWDRNYKSFRGEHFTGSKYLSQEYANRSRLFRPKTRAAVEKDLASAASSLFATVGAVSVTAGDEGDPTQRANASVMQELLNYRLDRSSGRNSIFWFLTAMGAREDADLTGICCSKQYWDYRYKEIPAPAPAQDAAAVEGAEPEGDQPDAHPAMPDAAPAPVPMQRKVSVDKPCVTLIPPENVSLHPAAHWMDPVNDGVYFAAWFPMTVGEIKEKAQDPRFPWREVDNDTILKARVKQIEASGVRRAREGGNDRLEDNRTAVHEFDVVWVAERFMRIDGEDYTFYTLSDHAILTDPTPTEEVYPAFGGERPYVLGFGKLESHRLVPQSMVEITGPMQQEINDLVNLRLDGVKEALKPLTLVARGSQIDVDRLKRRGQNTVMLVNKPKEDVVFDRPPEVSQSSYAEMEKLNVDFDNIAGVFDGGSVQSNRQLNETVGGMKLLSQSANSVTEFNIRVWAETWVERVLSQVAKLESYYESDEKVLALAQRRAKDFKKFGFDEITDEMLSQEVFVRVAAGIGSSDPMEKMNKMGIALKTLEPIVKIDRRFMTGEIRIKSEDFIDEIMGNAGYRDGFDRFFEEGEPFPPPPGEGEQQGVSPEEIAANSADKKADRESKERIAKLNAKTSLAKEAIHMMHNRADQGREHKQENKHRVFDLLETAISEKARAKEMAQRQAQAPQQPGMGGGGMGAPSPMGGMGAPGGMGGGGGPIDGDYGF